MSESNGNALHPFCPPNPHASDLEEARAWAAIYASVDEPCIAETFLETGKVIKGILPQRRRDTEKGKLFLVFSASMRLGGSFHLQEFDPVAKRISKVESVAAGNRNAVLYLAACIGESRAPPFEVVDLIRDMCFGLRAIDVVLGTEMYLREAKLEPESSAASKSGRLRDLVQTEHAAIKRAGRILSAFWNAHLHVVYRLQLHFVF